MNSKPSPDPALPDHLHGHSIAELLSALEPEHYRQLVGCARRQLHAVQHSDWLRQSLAATGPEDLVQEALLKLQLGTLSPALGRHLQARYRVNLESFLACVKAIMASDLNNLVTAARRRHRPAKPHQGDLPATDGLLSRRDLHRVLFKQLYQRVRKQPALLTVVQDWEQRFLQDDRIGTPGMERNLVFRTRQLAREIIAELAVEISPTAGDGRELLL